MNKHLDGKKTYAAIIATVAVALAKPWIVRNLPPEVAGLAADQLHSGIVVALGSLALAARKAAKPKARVVVDDRR